MAELGIGVRVRTGWSGNADEGLELLTGTIIDGPVSVVPAMVRVVVFGRSMTIRYPATYWRVRLDNGRTCGADERYIFPIDDDNDQTTRHERELVEG